MHCVFRGDVYELAKKIRRGVIKKKDILSIINSKDDASAFLVSGRIFSLPGEIREKVLEKIIAIYSREGGLDNAVFLKWAMGVAERAYSDAESKIFEVGQDRILEYLETAIMRMEVSGVSVDGKKYPEHILVSQAGHLVSTLISVLYFLSRKNISTKKVKDKRGDSEGAIASFWNDMAHYESIKEFIQEVSCGNCIPVDVSSLSPAVSAKGLEGFVQRAKYYMDWVDPKWRDLEIYRDLNYKFYNLYEDDATRLEGVIKRSGMGRLNGGVMHFDLSRGKDFELELKRSNIIKLLELMYDVDAVCTYKRCVFTIRELVEYLISLYVYACALDEENRGRVANGGAARIQKLGIHRICKILGLPATKKELLDLLSCNLNIQSPSADVSIYLLGQDHYVIPSRIMSLCFEKVVDRIVVRDDVIFSDEVSIDKGYFFEGVVKSIVENSGRNFYKINRDARKGTPEIDGIFKVDGHAWAICEVKCSVKPECRRDAYQFTENHISGALAQLDERYDYLARVNNVVQGLVFDENEILLLIVTNHNYFTGLGLRTPKGREVFVVDSLYLNDVLNGGFVPVWDYSGEGQKYIRTQRKVKVGEVVDAIKNPIANLQSKEKTSFQIQESGIAIRIHKESVVDERSFYDEKFRAFVE
ncbi:hypothetical protein [Pseudomonas sp. R1-7]|uniref:hypothetical protein n=1 Tax=Pseudomonas sp. R1-7 TaxID=2817398 RepID=UPI003DA9128C